MYKIMLADDEGIVIDSLKFIIEKNFKDQCVVEYAKTGRSVIELAERFRPDIAFMDIQMPGINGIEAMKEIKKFNSTIIFIVMSAFDKFDYAKEAINLGVLEYLNKPVNHNKIVGVIKKSMNLIDMERERFSNNLLIKEKLETVVPVIENGLIYSLLFQEDSSADIDKYTQLLGIQDKHGYMMILEYGDSVVENDLTNTIGASVKAQSYYREMRETVKEFYVCVVGPIMSNKIVIFVPYSSQEMDYNTRIEIIDRSREMVRKLSRRIDAQFRLGIGSVKNINKLDQSYREAANSMKYTKGSVVHTNDLPGLNYEEDYPVSTEDAIFENIRLGKLSETLTQANNFFDWMLEHYPDCILDIKLKALEFVLQAEKLAFRSGGMTYHFRLRKDYLNILEEKNANEEIRAWFIEKISEACRNVVTKKKEHTNDCITKAKSFISQNYKKDISLDDVSRELEISPYYFSKLFKEVTGENFIEYLTNIRIEKAKMLLEEGAQSIKEICVTVGYSDPNYFSRIFKKSVGVTPTEFKEGLS